MIVKCEILLSLGNVESPPELAAREYDFLLHLKYPGRAKKSQNPYLVNRGQ